MGSCMLLRHQNWVLFLRLRQVDCLEQEAETQLSGADASDSV